MTRPRLTTPVLLGPALLALAASVVVLAPAPGALGAPGEEAIVPLAQYTTDKSRTLALTYQPQLQHLYESIYYCLPWVDIQKHGIGFRKPRWADGDARYLSVWIWIEQHEDARFAALAQEHRASAMFSRYGVELLRRMAALDGPAGDANVDGFAVILSWIKPGTVGRRGVQPLNETLALFADRSTGLDFVARRLPAEEFTTRARFTVFDGQQDLGRLPLQVWDDPFLATFKLKNYEPPPGVRC